MEQEEIREIISRIGLLKADGQVMMALTVILAFT